MRFMRRVVTFIVGRLFSELPLRLIEVIMYRALLKKKFVKLRESRRIQKREDIWNFVIDTVGASKKILFLEFGVFKGKSIKHFASRMISPDSRLYGFDSFEGLPEAWGRKPAGGFSTKGAMPASDDSRITFIKGWFQDSLPRLAIQPAEYDAVIVHLDADLYSSTLFVLSQLWGRVEVFYAVFDEFANDEARALYNFSQAFPCQIDFLAYDDAVNPQRVFCHIRRAGVAPTAS